MTADARQSFAKFAWGVTAYNLAVILWGAWVRITGSGAGCGEHWPTCHGEILPRDAGIETLIELTHRATSGITLILTVVVVWKAVRVFERGERSRTWAWITLAFVLAEAALGAVLVLEGLVDKNDSVQRAVVIALHLMNTNGLLAAGVLSALWAHPDRSEAKLSIHWLTTPILAGLVIVGMTGAITALGDTLFPVSPTDDGGLIARINEGTTTGEHFLVRLRIVHPIIAVLVSVGMMFISAYVYGKTQSALLRRAVKWVIGLVALQVSLGVLNVLLYAPGWMQLVHLLAADILWIVTVVMVVLLAEDEAAQAGLDKAEWVSNPLETQGTA
mgnify:CR=1 FL=1